MSAKERAQTISAGFVILSVANILVKIMSLVFVPLIRKFLGGDAGYSVYSSAYSVHAFVYVIATAGFPVAISKVVSEYSSTHKYDQAVRGFKLARNCLMILGAVLTVLLMIFAKPVAAFMNNEDSWAGILVLAPTLFICALMSAYRGFFQGMKDMKPTAFSQIIEQLVHTIVAIVLVIILRNQGIVWAVAGATVGTFVGGVVALLIIMYNYYKRRPEILIHAESDKAMRADLGGEDNILSTGKLLEKLLYYSLPITLSAAVQYGGDLLDAKMIKGGLLVAGLSEFDAKSLHGVYMAMRQLINVPGALASALCISVLPAVASAYAKKNMREVNEKTAYSFKLCYMIAVPIAFGMVVFAEPIYRLLGYGDNYFYLMLSSLSVVFLCTMKLQSSVLQGVNKMFTSSVFLIISVSIKAILNFILIRIPGVGIYGAIISTYVAFIIPSILNYIVMKNKCGITVSPISGLVAPAISSAAMAVIGFIVYFALKFLISLVTESYFGTLLSFVPAFFVSVLTYYFVMRKIKGLTDDDILQISPKLLSILKKLRLA